MPLLADADAFVRQQRRERELAHYVQKLSLEELRRFSLLSANAKTTVSLDMPIGKTCRPSVLCGAVCYAMQAGSPLQWDKCIVARLRNLRRLELSTTAQFVVDLERDFARKQRAWGRRHVTLDFLRVSGTGDLTEQLVAVVNLFGRRNPRVRVWAVTRKFELAAKLEPAPNVFLALSLDASTSPADLTAARRLVARHSRVYLSFLRTGAQDDTLASAIVFNEKWTKGLPFDSRSCPVDAGKLPLGNIRGVGGTACAICRRCFTDKVPARQRKLLDLAGRQDGARPGHKKQEGSRRPGDGP